MKPPKNIFWRDALATGLPIYLKPWGNSRNCSYITSDNRIVDWTSQDARAAQRALDLAVEKTKNN